MTLKKSTQKNKEKKTLQKIYEKNTLTMTENLKKKHLSLKNTIKGKKERKE